MKHKCEIIREAVSYLKEADTIMTAMVPLKPDSEETELLRETGFSRVAELLLDALYKLDMELEDAIE